MQPQPATIDPAIGRHALSGSHMRDAGLMPAISADDTTEARKLEISNFLVGAELLGLTTIGRHGWPVSHCMHFASVAGPAGRPILYLFTHNNRRKLLNVQVDPRVGVAVTHSAAGGDPAAAARLQMQGLAFHITDSAERERAMQAQFNKPNYGFTRQLGLDDQPAMRIDIVNAIWANPAGGLDPVTVDYGSTFEPVEV